MEEESDTAAPTTSINQPIVLNNATVEPPPYLDVLSFQSSRLLPHSRQEIQQRRHKGNKLFASNFTAEEEAHRLDELLSSLHLLLEPIQLPDLSHTKVFDPATSLLRPATAATSPSRPVRKEAATKMKISKLDKSDEVKLFYPTGAKNANMRDFIKETIQKHLSTDELDASGNDLLLGMSVSAPVLPSTDADGVVRSYSPTKARKAARKKIKLSTIKSPIRESLAPSNLLNPHLTKQAKDVIAGVRANSSKINELISK